MEDTKQTTQFKGQILTKVYRVWLYRKFIPVLIVELIVFSLVVRWLGRAVFVQRVFENIVKIMFNHPYGIFRFFLTAFEKTSALTKLLSLSFVILIALLIRLISQGILRMILVRKNYFGKIEKKE